METNALRLERTYAVLEEYAEAWAHAYRAELIAQGKRATGDLIKSIEAKVVVEGEVYSAVLSVADYYINVENGRRAGAPMPPISAILRWIKVKPVIPQANSLTGRVPTQEQLAWAIAKSISINGIPPTHAMGDANDLTWGAFESRLREALETDLDNAAYTLVKNAIPETI